MDPMQDPGQHSLEQIFEYHLSLLEQHTNVLARAALHFREKREESEIMQMQLRAIGAREDAIRCCMLFTEAQHQSRTKAAPSNSQSARAEAVSRTRKRASEEPLEHPLPYNAKRRRVAIEQPVSEAAYIKGKQPDYNGMDGTAEHATPQSSSPESTSQQEPVAVTVKYDDISAEVDARLQASARRRKVHNGEIPKRAVKRKRDESEEVEQSRGDNDNKIGSENIKRPLSPEKRTKRAHPKEERNARMLHSKHPFRMAPWQNT